MNCNVKQGALILLNAFVDGNLSAEETADAILANTWRCWHDNIYAVPDTTPRSRLLEDLVKMKQEMNQASLWYGNVFKEAQKFFVDAICEIWFSLDRDKESIGAIVNHVLEEEDVELSLENVTELWNSWKTATEAAERILKAVEEEWVNTEEYVEDLPLEELSCEDMEKISRMTRLELINELDKTEEDIKGYYLYLEYDMRDITRRYRTIGYRLHEEFQRSRMLFEEIRVLAEEDKTGIYLNEFWRGLLYDGMEGIWFEIVDFVAGMHEFDHLDLKI